MKRLNPEDRDNLVAYLDGELDDKSTSSIDAALAQSPVARHEVEMLTRTWELLDLLPDTQAPESFTQTTVQIALQGEAAPTSSALDELIPKIQKAVGIAAFALGLCLVSWSGYMLTQRWIENDADGLIENLPVVENLELFQDIENIDLLEDLKQRDTLP